ncbi:MAG: glycerophosphodiester phosphodiesterase [Polyangiaceae bacterium]|nr:glycerophosphodiester phosphodiesterase [Polyangiaceae bacterium]
MTRKRPLILAHRGARQEAPENTIAAFQRGLELGADGFELDVRLSQDLEVIVLHDPSTRRVAKGARALRAENHAYAELRRLDLGGGAYIPTLREAVELARERSALVNIELKHNLKRKRHLIAKVVALLNEIPNAPEFVFLSSFDPRIVFSLARALPNLEVGWLVHKKQLWLRRAPGWPWVGARALHPEHSMVTPALIQRVKERGGKVNTWTVNEVHEAERLAALGVDCIITDVPGDIVHGLGASIRAG